MDGSWHEIYYSVPGCKSYGAVLKPHDFALGGVHYVLFHLQLEHPAHIDTHLYEG